MSQEEIYTKLSSAGFAPHQAAGIIGNFEQESSLNPGAVNPKSGAYGLAQWLGPRKDALHKYASSMGSSPDDLDTQIGFLVNELNTTEREASKALAQTKTPQEAAAVFSRKYERAGANESRDNKRIAMATKLFEHIIGKYVPNVLDTLVPAANAAEKPVSADDGITWDEYIPAAKPPAPTATAKPHDDDVVWEEYIPAGSSFSADTKPSTHISAESPELLPSPDDRNFIEKGADAVYSMIPGTGDTPFTDMVRRRTPEGEKLADASMRTATRALAAPLSFGNTLLNLPFNAATFAENALSGENHPYAPNLVDEGVDKLLSRYDIPLKPETTRERVATAGLSAVTGAGIGRLLSAASEGGTLDSAGRFLSTNPGRQIVGAGSSAAASDLAADTGQGAVGQGIAGLLGGMAGSGIAGMTSGVTQGLGRAGQALTDEGKKKIAGRILYRQSAAPESAIARLQNPKLTREIIPGSKPTLPEVTQDPGQAFALRAMESSDLARKAGVAHLRDARLTEIDRGINQLYDKVNRVPTAGKPDIIGKLRQIKQAAYDKFAEGKDLVSVPIDMAPLTQKFDELYTRFQGNTNITNALARVEQALTTAPRTATQQADDAPIPSMTRTGVPINRDVDVEKDDVITAIRKMGGLTRDEWGDMDITRAFKPDPRGPVFAAAGNTAARGLDDMTSRLIEHGYLPPGSRPVDLEDLLTDIAAGVADDSRRWSSARSGFSNLDRGPQSQHDELMLKLSDLIDSNLAKANRGATATPKPEPASPPNFQRLWNARQELDNAIYGSWKDSDAATKKELARVGEELRGYMNQLLVEADPDFEPFLRRYSFAARMEDQLRLGRELTGKLQNASRNMPVDDEMLGDRRLSAAKSENLHNKLYTEAQGELSHTGQKLSARQLKAIELANLEKQRGEWLNSGGSKVGSPTAPYFAEGKLLADDIVGGILGDKLGPAVSGGKGGVFGGAWPRSVLGNTVGRLGDYAVRNEEQGIMRLLGRAYADPEFGLELLRLGKENVRPSVTLRGIRNDIGRTGGLAELYSILGR